MWTIVCSPLCQIILMVCVHGRRRVRRRGRACVSAPSHTLYDLSGERVCTCSLTAQVVQMHTCQALPAVQVAPTGRQSRRHRGTTAPQLQPHTLADPHTRLVAVQTAPSSRLESFWSSLCSSPGRECERKTFAGREGGRHTSVREVRQNAGETNVMDRDALMVVECVDSSM